MRGTAVDDFCGRLSRELQVLSDGERATLFSDIERREEAMRSSGQERPVWLGPMSVPDILSRDVVVPSFMGERCGRVICFGVVPNPEKSDVHERSVIVYVPSSGAFVEAPGSTARMADGPDVAAAGRDLALASRLRLVSPPVEHNRQPSQKTTVDDSMRARLVGIAGASQHVSSVQTLKTGTKIVGKNGRKIYVLQTRVDLSGFSIDAPGAVKLDAAQAKSLHLGSVRCQIPFSSCDVLAMFAMALEQLGVVV